MLNPHSTYTFENCENLYSGVAAKARILCQPQSRHQAWNLHAAHTQMDCQQLGKLKK